MSIALNIPASNGTGTASDVSALDPEKTFVIGGTLAPGEQIVIEGTADPTGANGWAGLAVFAGTQGNFVQIQPTIPLTPTSSQNLAPNGIEAVVNWMRVRRTSATTSTATPTISVDSTATATQAFQAIAVPAVPGSGATTNIAAQGTSIQATVSGTFGPTEQVLLEGSIDGGVSFDTIFAFTGPGTQSRDNCRYSLVRVTRLGSGTFPQTIQLFLGTSTSGSGGGGGANPNAFYVVTRATNAPVNAFNLGGLTTGILQQTVAAGVATPAALNVSTGLVPFGNAGLLTTSPTLSFTVGPGNQPSLTVGDGTIANSFLARLVLSNNSNIAGNNVIFQNNNLVYMQLVGSKDFTAVTGFAETQWATTPTAGGSGNDVSRIKNASLASGWVVAYLVKGDVALGGGANGGDALATNATNGFVFLPQMAGAPTGVPERNGVADGPRARQATVIDTTDGRWYYYDTGAAAWRFAQFANFDPTYNSVTAQAATALNLTGNAVSTWSTNAGGITIRANNGGVLGTTSTQISMSASTDITVIGNLTGAAGLATLGTAAVPWNSAASQSYTTSQGAVSTGTWNSDTLANTKAATFTINKSNGVLGIATLTANDMNFSTNSTLRFSINNASGQLKFAAASITAAGAVAVTITNAPAGSNATPVEYLTILNPAGTTRYIPLLGA